MKKIIVIFAAVILALMLFFGAGVSPLRMSMVPADASWVLHLDIEKYASSATFKLLSDEAAPARMQRRAGKFFEKFRIDPMKDLRTITVYGKGEPNEEPLVAISGNFDKAYLLSLLKTESSQKEIPYGKHTIYNWDNDHFGVFATDSLIFISQREENIKSALDAMGGKIKNISSSPLVARLNKESPNAIVLAAATDISGLIGKHEGPVILSKMRTAAFSIAEIGEAVDMKLDIAAESAPVAKEMEQAFRGLIAIVNLQLSSTDVQAFTQSINIALDGEKVRIDASYPIAKLVDLLKKHDAFPHISIEEFDPLSDF
jgi:hypothetical protein